MLGQLDSSSDIDGLAVIVVVLALAWAVFVVFWMVDMRRHVERIHFLLVELRHEPLGCRRFGVPQPIQTVGGPTFPSSRIFPEIGTFHLDLPPRFEPTRTAS